MNRIKCITVIIIFFCSCQTDFKYKGLLVKFIQYESERYYYSGEGWGNIYHMSFRVLKGNKHYKPKHIIVETLQDYHVKNWMVKRKLGKKFFIIKEGYAC